jgi:cytochrome c oxidase subunit 2
VRRRASAARFFGLLAVPLLAGCGGNQNVLDPQSRPERSIAQLWWVMMAGAWVGFGVVVFLLFLGWWRRNRRELPGGGGDKLATGLVVGLGVAVPILALSALFVWSDIVVMRSTAAPAPGSTALTIHVTGHQWWWEVRYDGTAAVTANEIHIPTGTRVEVVGTTADVIHSFWVPELNRKVDLIPGRSNRILLEADRPGRFRGQCSEFCGVQHAHMAVAVVAEPPAQFRAWLANMAKTAPAAAGGAVERGRTVFLSGPCASCHRIRGTLARGDVGPDLTHLATRATLAALTVPNRSDYLGGWIRDPQALKPGANMPAVPLTSRQLHDLVAFLESLH